MKTFAQQPAERIDYAFDFSKFVIGIDTVTTQSVTASPSDLTINIKTPASSKVVFWATGGTLEEEYLITGKIITSQGKTKTLRMKILVTKEDDSLEELAQFPDDILDYKFDFSQFLSANSDSISGVNIIGEPSGLTIANIQASSKAVTAMISAGIAEKEYIVTCTITTSFGDTKIMRMKLRITNSGE